jgi:hypothetical protein
MLQILGQLVQIVWPEQARVISTKLQFNIIGGVKLAIACPLEILPISPRRIIGQILMLLLVWSTFCNQFATRVFETVTRESVIFIAFFNAALYGFMSLVCACVARLPWLALDHGRNEAGQLPKGLSRFRLWLGDIRFDRKETAAICFCGAAKGNLLGTLIT